MTQVVTYRCLNGIEDSSTIQNHVWHQKPLQRPRASEAMDIRGEPTADTVLVQNSYYLPSKYLALYLHVSVVLTPQSETDRDSQKKTRS